MSLILLRLAPEIMLKARGTRHKLQIALIANLGAALERERIPWSVEEHWGRLLLETPTVDAAMGILPRVFGFSSFSPVEAVTSGDMDEICSKAIELYAPRLKGKKFAVRAKRLGHKVHSTLELERRVGAALFSHAAGVDLENPEVTVRLDAHAELVHFHSLRVPGPGGFPLGSQGRLLTMLSGGFDSVVAAWMMMRRGAASDFVFCNLGGAAYERMVLQVAKILTDGWAMGSRPRMFVVDFQPLLAELKAKGTPEFWQVTLKRLMLRAACRIARNNRLEAVVTGESLGQVSSQTLSNLRSIDAAAELLVLRPLIGAEKADIVNQARRIGTAALSEKLKEYCAITPRHPVQRSSMDRMAFEEGSLDKSLLPAAVEAVRVIDLDGLEPEDLTDAYVFVDAVPDGAQVIDIGPEGPSLDFGKMDRNLTYVLRCPHGTRSALYAELMQKAGFEAYAIRPGAGSPARS